MKRNILILLFIVFTALSTYAQQLVINEVSQGPSGSKEYVELLVVGSPTCNGIPTMDLRGYYIDDNNGTFATGAGVGIASGCVRFANVAFWSAIPYGTIIVIHNDNDLNPLMPANDLSMVDGNCLLVIPISDATLFEKHTSQPSTGVATYPTIGFVAPAATAWNTIGMSNTQGDSFQTRDASATLVHAVSWGSNSSSTIVYANASSAVGGTVFSMTNGTNNNPALSSNWSTGATSTNETPGAPNNAANAAWISTMNNGCVALQPFGATTASTNPGCTCDGLASITPTGAIAPYTFTWAPSGGNASSASALCAGVYTVTSTSSNNCTLAATYTLTSSGALTTATAITNPVCPGGTGSATVTPSGVAGPFTYTWTPSVSSGSTATGLTAGSSYTVSVGAGGCVSTKTITIAAAPSAITLTPVVSNPLCFGSTGAATVIATGGTGSYTYTWTPSASTASTAAGLSNGNQTITVGPSGCTSSVVLTVVIPSSLTITPSTTSVTCTGASNGSGTVTVSGGAGGYSYLWSSGFTTSVVTGQATGNLTVTVSDANGCNATGTLNIAQPATALTTATAVTNILCNGASTGAATVTAAGGTTPYNYLWSSGSTASVASAQPAGVITVTVTDANGCVSIKNVTISQPATALTTNTLVTNVLCNGASTGAATVTAAGGTTPYNYLWSTGATASVVSGQPSSVLTVTVTDANGCTSIKNVTISQPVTALTTNTSVANVLCNGASTGAASVTAVGGTTAYNYLWSTGATASVVSIQPAGVLTVTVTDANGCTSNNTVTISQPASALTTNTLATTILCNGASTGAATVTAAGGTTPYNYLWSTGATASLVSAQPAGVLTVTVTDANGCTSIKNVTISQPATALTTNTSVTNVLCNGASTGAASVTAAGGTAAYNYLWSSGATASVVSAQPAGVLTVTVTDANGCTSNNTVTISEPASAISIVTSQTNAACGLSNGIASATVNGGTGLYTYTWAPVGGNLSLASGLSIGNYSVSVNDANGCLSVQTLTITQPNSMTVSVSSTSLTCNGGTNATASATVLGVTGPYSFTWSPAPGAGQGTTNALGLSAQIYTLAVSDNAGCVTLTTTTVQQPVTPLSGLISTTNITCFGGATGVASVTASGGTGSYTYTWSPSGGNGTSAIGLIAGSYTVSITDANSCTVSSIANVTEPALPLGATINATNVLCFGGNSGSASVNASGGTATYNYTWAPGGSNLSIASNLSVGTYTAFIMDSKNCSFSITTAIAQPASNVTAAISNNSISCFGLSNGSATVLPNGGTAGYTYTWLPSGGNASNATNLSAGNYTAIVNDANNCTFSISTTVTQASLINVNVDGIKLCNGQIGTLNGIANGGQGPYTFVWDGATGASAFSVNPTSTTVYSLNVVDNNGCTSSSDTALVLVSTPLQLSISPSKTICINNNNISLSATPSGGLGTYQTVWMPLNINAQTIVISPTTTTVYSVTVSDNCSQPVTLTTTITVESVTASTLLASNFSGCSPLCVDFTNSAFTSTGNIISSTWNFGDGTYGSSLNNNHCYTKAGSYTVTNSYVTLAGCVNTTTLSNAITVSLTPVASFYTGNPQFTYFTPDVTFINNSLNATSYFWDFSGLGTSTLTQPSYSFNEPGKYLIALIAKNGSCADTVLSTIECLPEFTFYAPNAFTPNDDNLNEVFLPVGEGWVKESYVLRIFDRWGEIIFMTAQWDLGWNGKVRGTGDLVKDDVYIWKVSLKDIFGKQREYTGHIEVVK